MDIKASYLAITGGVEAMRADALLGILKERGRGFASDSETWAELRLALAVLEKQTSDIKKVHNEMWEAVKDRNPDAFSALCQEFERSAATLCGDWARASVLAKIALEDPELPTEPTREEKIAADQARLAAIHEKLGDLRVLLPEARGEVHRDLEIEQAKLNNEELEIEARLTAAGAPLEAEEDEKPGRSTYYEYAGDMTPEEYEAFQKKVDEERARLREIREIRMDIAERLPVSKKPAAAKLRKQDEELAKEEADIVAALADAGALADEPPDEE